MDVADILNNLVSGAEYRGSLTSNTQAAYDALVWSDARAKPSWNDIVNNDNSLAVAKAKKNEEIDRRTGELIVTQGFAFDGQTFSLSLEAQSSWEGIGIAKEPMNTAAMFPFPITARGDAEYELAYTDVDGFLMAGLTVVATHKASGRALKALVLAAADVAAVDAVEDNRSL